MIEGTSSLLIKAERVFKTQCLFGQGGHGGHLFAIRLIILILRLKIVAFVASRNTAQHDEYKLDKMS